MVGVLLGVVALLLAACSGSEPRAPRAAAPRMTVSTTTSTLAPAPDLSQVALPPVPGRMRALVDMRPGGGTLAGTVAGPEGPVSGAVVHAERLVGDGLASMDVLSGPDGRWRIGGIKGGRYRVRAWRSPDLVLLQPELFFLASTEVRELSLVLELRGGPLAVPAIAPDPPLVNQPANLGVRLVERRVDDRGVVRSIPSRGVTLELRGAGQWQVRSSNPAITDATGVARWEVTCVAAGSQPLAVVPLGSQVAVPLALPPCR